MLDGPTPPGPPEPPSAPGAPALPAGPGYLPLAAYPAPALPPPPPVPTWTRSYEVPTARRVVSTGLQLAVDSTAAIRRASIYIGLLALGAFGPAVLLLLLGIARLLSDPGIAATIATNPEMVFVEQPGLAGPLFLIYGLLIGGIVLLVAISIDAQAIAISLLGGRASEQPLRLWEAIVRARQVFWRLAGAGLLVGLTSTIVTLVVSLPFIRPFDSNTGVTFIGSMVGALVVTPFAFSSTGIVLGNVGATEALRRSMALFRARPRIALVVTLFTLVTSAIQSFAISAGADAVTRVGEFMHLNLEDGAIPLVITAIIALAFIVAFGSLTFTIAAIVAAPQVTGFLGLTYYSGGLDKARSPDGARPRRFRWVSLPMIVAMVGLLLLAGLGLPSIYGFQARAPSPMVAILRATEGLDGRTVFPAGIPNTVEDPTDDGIGARSPSIDLVSAEYAYLPEVPQWFLDALFDCTAANVACGDPSSGLDVYHWGGYLFQQRMAGPPDVAADRKGQWGPLIAIDGQQTEPFYADEPLSGASEAILTRMEVGQPASIHLFVASDAYFDDVPTNARSTWIGNDLLTLVPVDFELESDFDRWDVTASIVRGAHDALRSTSMTPLRAAQSEPFQILFLDMFGFTSFEP